MSERTLFDPGPPDPKNDATPLAGGAGVTSQNIRSHCNFAPARRNAPGTSHEAARHIEAVAGELCQRVLAFIRSQEAEGATDAEVQVALGMLTQTETARRNALAKVGAVVNSGRKRLTPSKRRAIVWVTPEHFVPPGTTSKRGEP